MNASASLCIVLASGASHRMGVAKAGLRFEGRSFLERSLLATNGHTCVAVVPREFEADVRRHAEHAIAAPNAEPARGMTHALRLGLAAYREAGGAGPSEIVVILVDVPLIDATLVATVIRARGDADVAFPERAGRPGHPVVFGPRAIALVHELPEGDTLRALRDDDRLTRRRVPVGDERPYRDIDTPEAYEALLNEAAE